MSSEDLVAPENVKLSPTYKRTRKSKKIPFESGHSCIAAALAKVINRMVNKELQQRCKELLEMEDFAETEARILFMLQEIDKEREEESAKKESNKKRRVKRRSQKSNDLKQEDEQCQ